MVKSAKVSSTVIEKSAEGSPVQSNEPKTICIITTYPHFGRIYSEMGKENKLTLRNYIIYLQTKKMNEMRWKWNLAFNSDDGKKNYTLENYLQKIIYKNKNK